MELLIKDFRISLSSIHSSIMELYRSTESSKGIYSIYIGYLLGYFGAAIDDSSILNITTNDFIVLNCVDCLF